MSESLLLTILTLGELTLITAVLAVFIFLRYRRMSQRLNEARSALDESNSGQSKDGSNYSDYLQQYIEHTNDKLSDLPAEKAKSLQARLAFLQAEANAQKEAENSEAYWNRLINDLEGFLPQDTLSQETAGQESVKNSSDEERPILNELDDIDIENTFETIPTLQDNVSQAGVHNDPALTIESANDDLQRLRKIITRQHNTMDALKKSLNEKDIDVEGNEELSRKLEEVEIAQAQLNMCVETLEKENERLHELLKEYEDSPHQEQLLQAQQDLDVANERINSLEKENTLQAERIAELESEISALQQELEQRNVELSRLQSLEADLSHTNESDEQNQDSLMKEIETLTELITQKSEELSKLQNESSPDFSSALPELGMEEDTPAKAAKSG